MAAHRENESSAVRHEATAAPARITVGLPAILLGFVCFALSRLFERGFVHGLFQSATIALMILGAYLLGTRLWHRRRSAEQLDAGAHWLPSRDSDERPGS